MNYKHIETLWLLKKCTLYILCTLILSNPLHLTIGSNLILIQNELWVSKCYHTFLKKFLLRLRFPKNAIKISAYYISIIFLIYHTLGWKVVKNGSHVVCFHLHTWYGVTYLHRDVMGDHWKCVSIFVNLRMTIEKFRSPRFSDQRVSIKLWHQW
jgi:hypothetical protein